MQSVKLQYGIPTRSGLVYDQVHSSYRKGYILDQIIFFFQAENFVENINFEFEGIPHKFSNFT